jgi:hypothetical protein
MNPPADAAAEYLAERPGFARGAHQCIEGELRGFVVRRADANIALTRNSRELCLLGGISDVRDEDFKCDIGPNCANPFCREFGFPSANRRRREEVPVDVVRLVFVWLNERHTRHARVAGDEIENRHPAATGTDLE